MRALHFPAAMRLLPPRAAPQFRPFTTRRRLISAPLRRATAQQQATTAAQSPAAQNVEKGLALFAAGKYEEALPLFLRAQQQSPNAEEAAAAVYNAACTHTKLRQWQAAADAVVSAINDHNIKLTVALKDPDLEALRERREWLAALNQVKGGLTDKQYVKLRAEAKAPFRLTRMYIFGALASGAGLGLAIITTKLIAALQGNGDLEQSLQNFTINAAALAVFGYLLYRDFSKQQADNRQIEREEALGQLLVSMGGDRLLPLSSFRGTTRPVIIAGSKGQVAKALAAAEPVREQLRERGVSVLPLILNEDDPQARLLKLKAELSGDTIAPLPAPEMVASQAKGFGPTSDPKRAAKQAAQPQQLGKKDKRWQLEAANLPEWMAWVAEQKKSAQVADGNSVYVQVQLDGAVRASGVGTPPWRQFVQDLPELSSIRTKFGDGAAA